VVVAAALLNLCLLPAASDPAQAGGDRPPPSRPRTEINFIPVVGGDSDVGIGAGVVGDVARLNPDYTPYRWRAEIGAFITFKPGQGDGKVTSPFQDYYLVFTLPQLMSARRLRVEFRPSYTSESTQLFYGVGNASPWPPASLDVQQAQYARRRMTFTAAARMYFIEHFLLRFAVDLTQNWLTVRPDSILADQQTNGSERVKSLLDGPERHGIAASELAVLYDTRDNEIVTRHGSFHQIKVRGSPRLGPALPFEFGQVNATARFYRSPVQRIVLSARVVADLLFGDPPFYELTRVDDMSVVGGGKGIRGVPGQRYYGKIKVFSNVEGRVEAWQFKLRQKPFVLSTAAFFDSGRVWADFFSRAPELDGRGLGLKYGVGGGLRLQEGTTFIIRFDVAWSPDARPIAVYFNAGQIF
jgi:outer membrane protein assembly factor BamA